MAAKKLMGFLVAGLLGASLIAPVAQAQPGCGGGDHPTRTFDVSVKVAADLYEVGEKAKFSVRVKRVVEGQEVGPVEGAQVQVGVSLGDVYLGNSGTTGEDGRSVIKVHLERHAPAGLADVKVYASKLIADGPCHSEYEYEYGEIEKLGLFRVAR